MDRTERTHPLQRGGVVLLLAVTATLLWGTAFPGVKAGYALFSIGEGETASRLVFAGVRFLAAGALTLAAAAPLGWGRPLPRRGDWGPYALLGLVQTAAQYVFFYVGLSNTTGTKGSILNSTTAFLGVLLAHFLCRGERMTRQKALGCLVGFAGVVVVNLGGELGGAGFAPTGEGFMLLAALSQALGSILSQRVTRGRDPVVCSGWQLCIGGAALLAAGLLGGGALAPVSPVAWALLGYLVFLSAASFAIWTLLLKYNPVAKISIYNALVPVFGTLSSAVFLREPLSNLQSLAALALVCAGIYIVNRAPRAARLGKAGEDG